MNAQSPQLVPVLIVDEDTVIRDTLSTFLSAAGCRVSAAVSEADALAYLHEALAPHVVLLDFFLPLAHRSTVLHAAAHDTTLQRPCYLVVTATDISGLPPEEQRLIREVCSEVVPKPSDAIAVLAAVARAAERLSAQPSP
ncbi:MAG TPA: response regulator [Ktedonobacterales bacterium]|nr:response regulator [Ktedonobacterales bacterium]